MATLDLHLDFMEDEKPIRLKTLSSEEELQIVQDSTRLLEQIDEDCRVLDKMCSALENLFIIKEHYEKYGTSPALEALVGDIKQYLGISLEADETQTTDKKDESKPEEKKNDTSTDKKEGGGIGGAIKKVIDWICSIFNRIGEWLGLCEKKFDSDSAVVEKALKQVDLNKSYTIRHLKGLYSDGAISKLPDCAAIENAIKKAIEQASFKGAESVGASAIDTAISEFKPFMELVDTEVRGTVIKTIYQNTKTLWKNVYRLQKNVKPSLDELKANMENGKQPRKSTDKENFNNLLNIVKKSLLVIKAVIHRGAVSVASIGKTLYGKDNQKGRTDDEIKKEQQEKDQMIEQAAKEHEAEQAAAKSKKKK